MKAKFLIKLGLSLVMLALVLRMTNFTNLRETLLTIPFHLVVLVTAVYLVGQLLSSFKWWLIARAGGLNVSYFDAFKAYFIGMFVNCFGLGLVGGDVTRGVLLSRGQSAKATALASVVADRAHGLAVLALIGSVSALVLGRQSLDAAYLALLWGFIGCVLFGWVFGPRILLILLPPESKLYRQAADVAAAFPKSLPKVLVITLVSIIFHLVQIGLHRVIGLGLGVDLSWAILLVVIPFVNIVSSLPISWNGLGVRENAYTFFLVPHYLSSEQAVAFGAIWLMAMTFASVVGGFIALVTGDFSLVTSKEKMARAKGSLGPPSLEAEYNI